MQAKVREEFERWMPAPEESSQEREGDAEGREKRKRAQPSRRSIAATFRQNQSLLEARGFGYLSRLAWLRPRLVCLASCFAAGFRRKTVGHLSETCLASLGESCLRVNNPADPVGMRMKFTMRRFFAIACLLPGINLAVHASEAVTVREKHFAISGSTGADLYASIGRNGPHNAIAHTSYTLTWSRRRLVPEGGGCRLAAARPIVTITYTYPKPGESCRRPHASCGTPSSRACASTRRSTAA